MDQTLEETLKKIDQLLIRQENEKEKILKEIRSELAKYNLSSNADEQVFLEEEKTAEKVQQNNIEINIEMPEKQEEVSFEPKTEEPLLVAVVGTKGRVGTTHFAVSIANYLARNGKKTAVIEFNDSGEFSAMGRYFDKASEEEFFYKDVKYYADCTLQSLDQIAASGKFEFLILDLGHYSTDKTLFSRSDMKFMISGGKPWEVDSLLPIFKKINKEILFQTHFIFNFVPESEKEAIADGMDMLKKVYFSSFVRDPFLEADESIEGIFKEYTNHEDIPEKNNSKEKRKKTSKFLVRRNRNEENGKRRNEKRNPIQAVPATE